MRGGDDAVLTLNEIASCMITLLVAGHETTTAQINNALLHLLTEREHWQALCSASPAQRNAPSRLPTALEEMMRYDPSVCTWRRRAVKESVINGVAIPAGANLLLMLNAANRDEAIFPEPEAIQFERQEPQGAIGLRLRHPLLRRRAAGPAGDGDFAGNVNPGAAGHCGWRRGRRSPIPAISPSAAR